MKMGDLVRWIRADKRNSMGIDLGLIIYLDEDTVWVTWLPQYITGALHLCVDNIDECIEVVSSVS